MPIIDHPCPITRITDGPFFHFFGYYDKSPWNAEGRYILALRTAFMNRPPTPEDIAVIGMLDTHNENRWLPLAESVVWYWQQSNMLQWLPADPQRKIVFNTRSRDAFQSRILDVETRDSVILPRPIYAPSPDGIGAVSLNFARLHRTRPGYGYVGVSDATLGVDAPEDDGVWYMNLNTCETRLIISLAQLAVLEAEDTMQGVEHWVNHLQWNPSGTRFAFLHRWRFQDRFWKTRLITANPDGSSIAVLEHEGYVSHYDWRDDEHVLAWSLRNGEMHYHLYTDPTGEAEAMGAGVLITDGHCSYNPNRQWVLTDTYPSHDSSERTLILYHPATNIRYDIGRFYSDPEITGEIRCDLHPRWSRDGKHVCIDSIHEGGRQMYMLDVSSLVD